MNFVYSKNNVPIRLPDERWIHIIEEHNELAGYYHEVLETVSEPKIIYLGKKHECIAIKPITEKKHLIVIYRELNPRDGFIITAFLTRHIKHLQRRQILWQSKS